MKQLVWILEKLGDHVYRIKNLVSGEYLVVSQSDKQLVGTSINQMKNAELKERGVWYFSPV
jgi:hypothetical protein